MRENAGVVTHNPVDAAFLELFLNLGTAWVLYLLMILSVISVAITLERAIYFFRSGENTEAFLAGLRAALRQGGKKEAEQFCASKKSSLAFVAQRGLDDFERGHGAVEQTLLGATQALRLQLERGLVFLGTLGNNAPFIGLFGTVLGIIRAFRDLSADTSAGSEAVMAGIAEALVATAVGLLVALPAVAVFNTFQRLIRARMARADMVGRLLLSELKSSSSNS